MDFAGELESVRNKLRAFRRRDVVLSRHNLIRIQQRFLSGDDLVCELLNPVGLFKLEKQPSEYAHESKYKLYFRGSNRLDLIIIAVFQNNHVEVITAYHKNRKIKPKYINRK